MNYAIYDKNTGEIKSIQAEAVLLEGELAFSLDSIPIAYIDLYYMVKGSPVLRPVSGVNKQENVLKFADMHPEAIVTLTNVDGEKIEFPPQDVTLTSSGHYYVEVQQPHPYRKIWEAFYNA
tara:strand:- start:305 stop:667 length:363 start_codon:yes stop_codon:yes gene_type:complete